MWLIFPKRHFWSTLADFLQMLAITRVKFAKSVFSLLQKLIKIACITLYQEWEIQK